MKNILSKHNFAAIALFTAILGGGLTASAQTETSSEKTSQASRGGSSPSTTYIWNTPNQQLATFNVSGNGVIGGNSSVGGDLSVGGIISTPTLKVSVVDSEYGVYIGGQRVLHSTGKNNLFAGIAAGNSTATGASNTYFGQSAGEMNANGSFNTFVGVNAGKLSTVGYNTFVGSNSGASNSEGAFNTFFGGGSGSYNTSGKDNTFLGYSAGGANKTGNNNVFVGVRTGSKNDSGSSNIFIGSGAGYGNFSGNDNIYIGNDTGYYSAFNSNNIAIGNSVDFDADVNDAVAIGNDVQAKLSNQIVLGKSTQNTLVGGMLGIGTLGQWGSTQLCLNNQNVVAYCSSSIRFKRDVQPYTAGLELIKQLRPVSYIWKDSGTADVGFVAEEVNKIEPLLSVTNADGAVEGVKYDRVTTALVNAVKEQQEQIDRQQKEIRELRSLICSVSASGACKP